MARSAKRRSQTGDESRYLLALHRRLVRGDLESYEEIPKLLFPRLTTALLRHCGGKFDRDIIESAIDEALVEYVREPGKFDPRRKVPLEAFLLMAANRNVANTLRSERRRKHRERKAIKDKLISQKEKISVELELSAGNIIQSERETATQRILASVLPVLSNSKDNQVFQLMLRGVREQVSYAGVMGITDLPLSEQRRRVKRAKARITKFLRRHAKPELKDD